MESTPHQPATPWSFPIALACICAALSLGYSVYAGRLSLPLPFDDIFYLNDGIDRLEALQKNGLWGFLESFWTNPPHAPLLSIQAFAGLLLSGGTSAIPVYALASLWMAGFLVLLWKWCQNQRFNKITTCYLLSCVAITPLFNATAIVFRPDILASLATVVMVGLGTYGNWRSRSMPYLFALAASISILAKPTVFPQMCILIAWILLVNYVRASTPLITPKWWKNPAITAGVMILLMTLPYAIVGGRKIVEYILINNFGPMKEIWSFNGAWAEHMRFYIDGPASWLLGRHLGWAWCAMAAAGLIWQGLRRQWTPVLLWGGCLFISYVIPTMNWHKNTYLGTVFQGLLIATAVQALFVFGLDLKARGKIIMACFFSIALLFGMAQPDESSDPEASMEHRRLVEAIRYELEAVSLPNPRIGMAMTGTTNLSNLRFDLWKTMPGTPAAQITDIPLIANGQTAVGHLAQNDIVVTTKNQNRFIPDWIPTKKIQNDISLGMENDSEFHLSQSIGLFKIWRRDVPFEGVHVLDGLGPIEGPYPPNLWRVRWGLYPATEIGLDTQRQAKKIDIIASSDIINQSISIIADGTPILSFDMKEIGKPYAISVELPSAATRLTFRYNNGDGPQDFKRSVLFRKFKVQYN